MTLDRFNLLVDKRRLALALLQGTFIATRWPAENETPGRYRRGDFFVEVHDDTAANVLLTLRSFDESEIMPAYALPALGVYRPDSTGSKEAG